MIPILSNIVQIGQCPTLKWPGHGRRPKTDANHGQSVDQPLVEDDIYIRQYMTHIYPSSFGLNDIVHREFVT